MAVLQIFFSLCSMNKFVKMKVTDGIKHFFLKKMLGTWYGPVGTWFI